MKLRKLENSTFDVELDGAVFTCRKPDEKDQMLMLAGPVEQRVRNVCNLIKAIDGVEDADGKAIDRDKFFQLWDRGKIPPKQLFEIMEAIAKKLRQINEEAEEKNEDA